MNKREKSIRISVAAMGIGQSTADHYNQNIPISKEDLQENNETSEIRSFKYIPGMEKKNQEDVD